MKYNHMQIHLRDNVSLSLEDGHKYALKPLRCGDIVIKYGQPIGHVTCNVSEGEWVHTHNMKTNLNGIHDYCYEKETVPSLPAPANERFFMGYCRENGDVGIRNDIWIVNTVGCVNKIAERLAVLTGAKAFPHPFGCSQLGDDQEITQKILAGMVNHPNAGGVLVLGLGCENNHIGVFQTVLESWNPERVKFLNTQDVSDEIAEGVRLIEELKEYASSTKRERVSLSKLKVGLKCGGSDSFSGITANPLVGRFSERFIAAGGCCVLTEVPEMFGAEHLLMNRCRSREVFEKTVQMINRHKEYFQNHQAAIYENPSPGNKKGGITTLEEKSLGCIQKGGLCEVVDVLDYGDRVTQKGLSLLAGPGNDMVAVTNLMAAGVQLVLFTTGRGTPLGGAVPTVKISTNSDLAKRKAEWVDFDAGPVLTGADLTDSLFDYVLDVANGQKTKNEQNGYEEISIFKDGVIL